MEIRFRISVDVPDMGKERPNVRAFFIHLAAELIRVTAQMDGEPKTDVALEAVADVLAAIPATDDA